MKRGRRLTACHVLGGDLEPYGGASKRDSRHDIDVAVERRLIVLKLSSQFHKLEAAFYSLFPPLIPSSPGSFIAAADVSTSRCFVLSRLEFLRVELAEYPHSGLFYPNG